jgi:hypothetical protein
MTPKALFSGARMAVRLARECDREDDRFEAMRHRERARDYLRSRRMVLLTIKSMQEETTNVPSRT